MITAAARFSVPNQYMPFRPPPLPEGGSVGSYDKLHLLGLYIRYEGVIVDPPPGGGGGVSDSASRFSIPLIYMPFRPPPIPAGDSISAADRLHLLLLFVRAVEDDVVVVDSTVYWHVFRIHRISGEPKALSKADFLYDVQYNPWRLKIEATDKVRGFTGYVPDAPSGTYGVQGPSFRRHDWTAVLVVDRGGAVPYSAT